MIRGRILDLFCGAGGIAAGYARAGFHVVGVDLSPQPNFPYTFLQADAIDVLGDAEFLRQFSLVHASPPCQAYSAPTTGTNAKRAHTHPRLIEPTRILLQRAEVPYVIENVAGSTVRKDVMLCGEMFGLDVIMHRFFELGGWSMAQPEHPAHRGRVRGWRHGVYHAGPYVACYGKGGGKATVEEMQLAKGIDWTDDHLELREAIPPAYSAHIGHGFALAMQAAA